MSTFTPGPWTADLSDPEDIVIYGPTASVWFGGKDHETPQFIANVDDSLDRRNAILQVAFDVADEVRRDPATAAANARLIAAAPEMYEALQDAVRVLYLKIPEGGPVIARCRAALAKAEGKS